MPEAAPAHRRGRGRPKGSRTISNPPPVRHEEFLGLKYSAYSEKIPPGLWNLLTSLIATLFRRLVKIAEKLQVEAPGDQQERILFVELPQMLFLLIGELASWWWSYDRGFLGTTLKCPDCSADLKYEGDAEKQVVSLFGILKVRRAYYLCSNNECGYSMCPLDHRLGLDEDKFLPSVQEVVTWLTSLDPYGKSLEFIGKLLHFSISHRSAWLITQKLGRLAHEREDERIAQAFGNPAAPVFPAAELPAPDVGVAMFDGTCGRIEHDEAKETPEANEDDPDAPAKQPDFREVKLALAAHLVPPPQKGALMLRAQETSPEPTITAADEDLPSHTAKKSRHRRKVRPQGEEPTLAHKKLAVHLGPPLRLFQMLLILIHRQGLNKAGVLLVIGDGAHWIWRGVTEHLAALGPKVVEILDYWHAVEHLWKLANSLYGQGRKDAVAWVKAREAELLHGCITQFFSALEATLEQMRQTSETLATLVEKELTYFRNNESRINYADYLAKGYLIGSGAMEGSCRHHVKERIDRGGMQWSASGAMAVLLNRTLIKNGDWNDFWKNEALRRWNRYQQLSSSLKA